MKTITLNNMDMKKGMLMVLTKNGLGGYPSQPKPMQNKEMGIMLNIPDKKDTRSYPGQPELSMNEADELHSIELFEKRGLPLPVDVLQRKMELLKLKKTCPVDVVPDNRKAPTEEMKIMLGIK